MGLGKKFRLGKHSRFTLVYREGTRADCRLFILYYFFPRDRTEGKHFGFTVTKKIGNAVIRNKIRRRLQEAVRILEPQISEPLDLVIVAKHRAISASFEDTVETLTRCLKQKKLLIKARNTIREA